MRFRDPAGSRLAWVSEPAEGRPTVLALRIRGLNGFLAAVPALRAIADAFPDCRRILVASGAMRPLADLIPWPGYRHAFDLLSHPGLVRLPRSVERPNLAINLHGPRATEHRIARGASPAPVDQPPLGHGGEGPVVGPRHERCPPLDVAARLRRDSVRPLARALASDVVERSGLPAASLLAGRTDVGELARIVSGASRVLSSDGGISPLAGALGTSSLTLYHPRFQTRLGLPRGRPRHRSIVLEEGDPGDADGDARADALAERVLDSLARLPVRRFAAPSPLPVAAAIRG